MKELTEEKRFALAAALLFRQLARAYDDAADMLIRQVQRIHHAKGSGDSDILLLPMA
jgi:hypothetical protein